MSRTKKGRKVYTKFLIPDGVDDWVQFPSCEDYQALNDGKARVLITNKDYVGLYCVDTEEELLKVFEAEKIRIEREAKLHE